MKHDWQRLQDQAVGLALGGLYVEAAQRAIVQADPGLLADLLKQGLQPPAFLLPIIADALLAPHHPRPSGPRPKLTERMTRQIAGAYHALITGGVPSGEAVNRLADALDVDERTIRRVLPPA